MPRAWPRPIRLSVWAAMAAAGLAAAWWARPAWGPLGVAAVWAYLLAPAVRYLSDRGLPRAAAVLAAYLVAAVVMAGIVVMVGPPLRAEAVGLVRAMPRFAAAGAVLVNRAADRYRTLPLPPAVRRQADRTLAAWGGQAAAAVSAGLRGAAGALPDLLGLVLAPFLGYYLLRDGPAWRRRVESALPARHRPEARRLVGELDRVAAGFLRGQILVAGAVGLAALAVSVLFALPYALLIGLLAAVSDLVPYVGPLIGALPAVLFALGRSPAEALWVLAAFLAIHQLEGVLLTPWLVGRRVGVHPLVAILALWVAAERLGLVGMLLAVPAAGVGRVLLVHLLEHLGVGRRRRVWRLASGPRPTAIARRLHRPVGGG
jgi:predicted PurR-regulated permease PerM